TVLAAAPPCPKRIGPALHSDLPVRGSWLHIPGSSAGTAHLTYCTAAGTRFRPTAHTALPPLFPGFPASPSSNRSYICAEARRCLSSAASRRQPHPRPFSAYWTVIQSRRQIVYHIG